MTVDVVRAPHLLARALAATVLVMVGATGAHTWAGGHLPGVPWLLAAGGVVLGGSLLFLRGLATWRLLLPGVALAQALLHGLLATLGSAGASAGHAAHAAHAGPAAVETGPVTWSWQMLLAHTLSAALTALAWWVCDRATRVLVGALTLRPSYAASRRTPVLAPASVPAISLVHLLTAPRRGPPLAARHA